ncbi:penicillin acylase family protein [Ideonella paludis]|uniref:penicillin acylase family protein n=1 Tax=Ideonella paludis TaxID=1233411 RepID=UPI00362A0DAB
MLGACTSTGSTPDILAARTAQIERTTHGVAHITAPDMETLAYGVAYAHAQDNVCQTAQQLLTVRGERSKFLGGSARGLLGLRALPNEQIDFFIAAHMDDAALERAWARSSTEAQAMVRGYVAGFNRYLADHAQKLPASCAGQAWVRPMTEADMRRLSEISSVQAGIAALADGMLGAQPQQPKQPRPQACRRWRWPPLKCASGACSTRLTAPTPGPLAKTAAPMAGACCWATRTSLGWV